MVVSLQSDGSGRDSYVFAEACRSKVPVNQPDFWRRPAKEGYKFECDNLRTAKTTFQATAPSPVKKATPPVIICGSPSVQDRVSKMPRSGEMFPLPQGTAATPTSSSAIPKAAPSPRKSPVRGLPMVTGRSDTGAFYGPLTPQNSSPRARSPAHFPRTLSPMKPLPPRIPGYTGHVPGKRNSWDALTPSEQHLPRVPQRSYAAFPRMA